jgi:hypothetical protein
MGTPYNEVPPKPTIAPTLIEKLNFLQKPIHLMEQGVKQLQNVMSDGQQAGTPVVTVKQAPATRP